MDGNQMTIYVNHAVKNLPLTNLLSRNAQLINGKLVEACHPKPLQNPLRYILRPHQIKNLDILKNNNYTINVAPTGSGKSITMICYAAHEYTKYGRGTIVIVPKLNITEGFLKYNTGREFIALDGNTKYAMEAERIVAFQNDKVDKVREYINSGSTKVCIVCSYQAFISAMEGLNKDQIKSFSLLVDETHHSNADEDGTCLGEAIDAACDLGMKVHLFTATDFRSDGGPIVPPKHKDLFKKYKLTLYEYFLKGGCPDFDIHVEFYDRVKASEYDQYGSTGLDCVRISHSRKLIDAYVKAYLENPRPTLMIGPSTMKFQLGDEIQTSAQFMYALEQELRKATNHNLNILQLGSRDGSRLFSTLPESVTSKEYRKLGDDSLKIDIVLAIKVTDEGTDWPDCEQTFSPHISGSLQLIMQRAVGRALRNKDGKAKKSHVWFFEMGIDVEDKPIITSSLVKLALRMKSFVFGHEWKAPFRFKLPGLNRDELDESKDGFYELPYNVQDGITQSLNEFATDGCDINSLIEETISECGSYGVVLDAVAAAELLVEKDILSNKVRNSLDECTRINNSVGFASGDFQAFLEFLDENYQVNSISDYVGILSGIPNFKEALENYQKAGENRAIERLWEVITWYKEHGELPRKDTSNKIEEKLSNWLCSMKRAKIGKKDGNKWYPILEEIATENNLPEDIFNLKTENDRREKSIQTLYKIIAWYKEHKKLPNQRGKSELEIGLGIWLQNIKKSKHGKNNSKWYPILEEIAIENNLPEDIFLFEDKEEKSIHMLHKVIEWHKKHGKLPNKRGDKIEAKLGRWLQSKKMAKIGKGSWEWYPILEEIAIENNLPDIFEISDQREKAIQMLHNVIAWYKEHGKLPRTGGNLTNIELKLGSWISGMRKSKNDIGNGKWYPILEEIAINNNLPRIFKTTNESDRKEKAIQTLYEIIAWYKEHGKLPRANSKFGNWLSKMRQARRNKGTSKWYPELEQIAIENGLPHNI